MRLREIGPVMVMSFLRKSGVGRVVERSPGRVVSAAPRLWWMDPSGRRCRGGALPPALAGQAAGSRAPGRAGRRYLCPGGSDRRAPDRRAGPRRAVRRVVTILRREAAAGVSAALLHFADAWCAAVLVHHEDRAAAMRRGAPSWYPLWKPPVLHLVGHFVRNGVARTAPVAEASGFADDEEVLDVPGRPRVIHTPGHTAGNAALSL